MILVQKPAQGPAALQAGVALTADNCSAFDKNPDAFRAGTSLFAFRKAVYGPESVKAALKVAQHHKCCFCEARFDANYAGDVEHYRPKGAVTSGKVKLRPGYYWLAYSWSNLYYACADCNQYRKRDQFPLADEAVRAQDHHAILTAEAPLILDPGGAANPRDHIRFVNDVPTWTTAVGERTIKVLKLDRDALNLSRRTHFQLLDAFLNIIKLGAGNPRPEVITIVAEARAELTRAVMPSAPFSAAAADYLAGKI